MTHLSKNRRVVSRAGPGGFSLLETTIAVGILGIGLIMVAAVFPVALTQHRDNVDQARALELTSKAQALMTQRLDASRLWVDPAVLSTPGLDSPWYLLPILNLTMNNATWDNMPLGGPLTYVDVINGVNLSNNSSTNASYASTYPTLSPTNPLNPTLLFGLDVLSDRIAPGVSDSPFTDSEFMEAPNRLAWYGFYRRAATGSVNFATAICKQRTNQIFVEQDLSVAAPFSNPTVNAASARRLPVPWRVSVAYPVFKGNVLSNAPAAPLLGGTLGLARLAPIGAKIMVSGGSYTDGASAAPVPAGVILTVSDIIDDYTVEFVGDSTGLPLYDPAPAGAPHFTFDVWVFPPAQRNGDFGKESPVLDWKVFQ